MNIKKQMIYLTVLPRASNAGLQSPIWRRLRCYVIFLSVESTLADEKWRKCWFSIPYSFTDLKEGFTRRKYIKNHLNGRLERKYCILWDFQIPNSKKGDQSLENGKKTGKIRMLLELTYLLFSKWFKSFLQITGRAHPHNSWNNKHKRPRDPTLGGQTDLISAFWSIYFEHHSHNFYNPNPLILKL